MESIIYIMIASMVLATIAFVVFIARSVKDGQVSLTQEISSTRTSINNIDEGIKNLNSAIEGNIVPCLKEVYQAIEAGAFQFRGGDMQELFRRAGIEKTVYLDEAKKGWIGFGLFHEDLNVSFLVRYDFDSKDLVIRSSSAVADHMDTDSMIDLIHMSHRYKIGSVGVMKKDSSMLVTVDYSWHLPSERVSASALWDIISRLFWIHDDVFDFYRVKNIQYTVIFLPDYIEFIDRFEESKNGESEKAESPGDPFA